METTSKPRVQRSSSERAQIVATYKSSGLSQEAFCKREGLSKSSLYKWCRQNDKEPSLRSGFINIEAKKSSEWNIELELKSGTVIRLK
jgi:transposase-like protein